MAECRAPGERREALSEKLSVLHRRAVGAQSGAVRKQEPDRSGNGQGGRNRIWLYQKNCIKRGGSETWQSILINSKHYSFT